MTALVRQSSWRHFGVIALMLAFLHHGGGFVVVVVDAASNTAAGMETLIGIRGRDFVLLCADTAVGPGIVWTSTAVDKIATLAGNSNGRHNHGDAAGSSSSLPVLAACAGDAADADHLVNLLQAQAMLHEYSSGAMGSDVEYIRIGGGSAAARDDVSDNDDDSKTRQIIKSSFHPSTTSSSYTVSQMAHLARAQIHQQLRTRTPSRVCLLVGGIEKVQRNGNNHGIEWDADDDLSSYSRRLQWQIQGASNHNIVKQEKQPQPQQPKKERNTQLSAASVVGKSKLQPRLYWLDELGTLQQVPYAAHGIGSVFVHAILDESYTADMTRDEAIALARKCFDQLAHRYAIRAPQPPCLKLIQVVAAGTHGQEVQVVAV